MSTARAIDPSPRYCGPWALWYLLRRPWPELRAVVNRRRGRRPSCGVLGMGRTEMGRLLEELAPGCEFRSGKNRTLARFALAEETLDRGRWIVCLSSHFVVIDGGILLDRQNARGVLMAPGAPYRRARVLCAWKLPSGGAS